MGFHVEHSTILQGDNPRYNQNIPDIVPLSRLQLSNYADKNPTCGVNSYADTIGVVIFKAFRASFAHCSTKW